MFMYQDNKRLLKNIVSLAVPSILEYTLQVLVSYVDYIMVGKLGTEASATIGLTTEVSFLIKGGVNAVGIGALSNISYLIGAKRMENVKVTVVQAYYLAIVVGMISCMVSLVISPYLPIWLGADSVIHEKSSKYFAIVSTPFVFFSINAIFGHVLKATGDMKTPLYVNSFMNVSNIVLNFFLIYDSRTITILGKLFVVWGANLGVIGAGVATAISTVVGGILMIFGVYKNKVVSPKNVKRSLNLDIIRRLVKVGIPVLLTRLTSSSGRVLFTGLVARLGMVSYTAHTLSFTAESFFYIPCVGMMSAVATLSGNAKGENSLKKLNSLTVFTSTIASSVMLLMSLILFIFAKDIISIFTEDVEVISIATSLLRIVSINEPIFAVSIVLESVFNGIGDTKSPFMASTITLWVFRVLGTYMCIYVLGFGIKSAWVCMIFDNIARCLILLIFYVYKNKSLIYDKGVEVNG